MTKPPFAPTPNAAATASQVAWQFVPQYYTHMNQHPENLHRFYTKSSYYLNGVEGEETATCQGQAEIDKRIREIDYKDCKVFIHSVDAQASANNGILVQVIGEMSNNAEPWRKFVQTFFLAEQTNGYFVLNDNFRYLKEESFTDEDDEQHPQSHLPAQHIHEPVHSSNTHLHHHAETYGHVHTNGFHAQVEKESTPALPPIEVPKVEEPPREPTPEPQVVHEPVEEPAYREPSPIPPAISPAPPSPAPEEPAPVPQPVTPLITTQDTQQYQQPSPATTPAPQQHPPTSTASAAPPAPIPQATTPAPPVPKTWANLAAANSSKWGHTVAQEAKGVSAAAPAHAPAHTPAAPPSQTSAPPRDYRTGSPAPRGHPPNQHPAYTAALNITSAQCFVKGVTENIPQNRLEEILTQRFGPIKECEVVRTKACAFLEFKSIESARRAIIVSLLPIQGGEGGIKLDEKEFGAPARLNVEIRKERGDRPPPRPRGGAPEAAVNDRGRGAVGGPNNTTGGSNFRGGGGVRGGAGGRGRGDGVVRGK